MAFFNKFLGASVASISLWTFWIGCMGVADATTAHASPSLTQRNILFALGASQFFVIGNLLYQIFSGEAKKFGLKMSQQYMSVAFLLFVSYVTMV
eukprot:CAMPEP_0202464092 /NCGR_PEP_ID=MMETSP1360-20130828/60774_1 /ASSEMBLY_ACC=CAM_ASM_000848 /TAXON_ID=515479 /ORGANISM="Licmophora paradoxa, Strain CCMP2313" /LENGTH=94 /DNA_ID=CAMNT_0049087257 /DNA_START=15 /DNA_END=299 /DNA_ORIENTATION=-